jgi:hypothetical protein
MNEPLKRMFYCQCQSEGILVSYYPDDEAREVYLSMWSEQPYGRSHEWRHGLRRVWNILRKGCSYLGDVVLSDKDAMALGKVLSDIQWTPKLEE